VDFVRSVGIKTLKNRLSEYVRLAAGGEIVLVTDRDRVVAELRAPEPGRASALANAMFVEGMREGWLAPPTATSVEPPASGRPVASFEEVMDELGRDRADR
jgi:antitoxin (DNA-binding transcriptional repressor) of toxin-antitoxin stability system